MDTYKGLLRRAQVWIETKRENFDPLVWNEKKAAPGFIHRALLFAG